MDAKPPAIFSSLGDFLKEPIKDELSRVHVKWNAGLEIMRPTSASTSTIQGRKANTVILDEYSDNIWELESKRLKAEYDEKRSAARREAEEREAHYKGDPLAGTF